LKVRISSDAEQDLKEGFWFYEGRERGLGSYFRSSVSADLQSLTLYGGIHPTVHGYRRALCQTFPYSIYYQLDDPETLTVVAVLDQRRDPDWVAERLG